MVGKNNKSEWYKWEVLILLWMAYLLNQADRQVFNTVLPAIRDTLNLTDTSIGLIATIFNLCYALMVPLGGWAGDKFSRKWVKGGIETIFNSSAVMMCIAIIATAAMLAMQTIIKDNYELLGDKQAYQEFGVVMLSMLLIAFLVLKSVGLAVSLANSIVGGGGNTNFQQKIAKLAAWTAKKVFGVVTGGIGTGLNKLVEKSGVATKLKENAGKVSQFANKMAGRDRQ